MGLEAVSADTGTVRGFDDHRRQADQLARTGFAVAMTFGWLAVP